MLDPLIKRIGTFTHPAGSFFVKPSQLDTYFSGCAVQVNQEAKLAW